MLAHVPSFGQNPRGSLDFVAYPVPRACMHVLGTGVPRRLGVARSASSAKAAQALDCSLTPGLRISLGRVTCMARAASVPGLLTLGFLLLRGTCVWVWVVVGFGFRLRPATPGWGVGLCVRLCVRSACTLPLLAGVCGVGVCGWVRVPAAPRHSLHTKTRDSKGRTLDVLAHRHGTNPQTSHQQPTRARKPTSGYALTTRGARTGIQHISPHRTEAGPQTGTRATPAQADAPSRGSRHLGLPGKMAETGTKSGPSTATARSTTEAKVPSVPILHASRTCRHAPRIARRRRSTGSIQSHAYRTTEAICMVPGQETGQTGHTRPTWQPAVENQMACTPGVGRKSRLKLRTLGPQAVLGVPGAAQHTRRPGTAGHRLDR